MSKSLIPILVNFIALKNFLLISNYEFCFQSTPTFFLSWYFLLNHISFKINIFKLLIDHLFHFALVAQWKSLFMMRSRSDRAFIHILKSILNYITLNVFIIVWETLAKELYFLLIYLKFYFLLESNCFIVFLFLKRFIVHNLKLSKQWLFPF